MSTQSKSAKSSTENNPKAAKAHATDSSKTSEHKITKADIARKIYDKLVDRKDTNREQILDQFQKEAKLTKSGALSYFHRFQKETGRQTVRRPTKMDKAKMIYDRMSKKDMSRKDIIAALISEAKLTNAGASTYFQKLKKVASSS